MARLSLPVTKLAWVSTEPIAKLLKSNNLFCLGLLILTNFGIKH